MLTLTATNLNSSISSSTREAIGSRQVRISAPVQVEATRATEEEVTAESTEVNRPGFFQALLRAFAAFSI